MAVYRRFDSVEDLLVAVASTPLAGRTSPADTGTLSGDLTDLLRRRIDLLAHAASRRGAAELLAAAAGSESIRAAMQASLEQRRGETVEVLRRARERGELRPELEDDLILDLLEGLVYYRLLWRYAPLTHAEVEVTIAQLLQGAAT